MKGFNFTLAMHRLCEDVTERMDEFRHIRMSQVAVTFAQARSRVSYGMQAKLTPLRFEAGSQTTVRHGRTWAVQKLLCGEQEMLYILTFYLPRFLQHDFREKMITVLHELYHISQDFDGDIRRHSGRYHVHSHSQKEYDRQMGVLVDQYMRLRPDPEVYDFLKHNYRTLSARYGGVVGMKVAIPKLIPLPKTA